MLVAALFVFMQAFAALGGNIKTWDINLDFTNAAYSSTFQMPFQLTNNLPSTGYLKVVFPFLLHYLVTENKPDGVSATYTQSLSQHNCGESEPQLANIFVDSENSYYIQFLQANAPVGLSSSIIYTLTLRTSGNSLNIQGPGVQVPIQLASVMAVSTTAMTIDLNPIAYVLALSTLPTNSMQINLYATDPDRYLMTAKYNVTLQVQLTKQLLDGGRLMIRFPSTNENAFTFEGYCIAEKVTCSVVDNQIVVLIPQAIYANERFSFMFYVRNPLRVTPSTYLEVRSLQLYESTIFEMAVSEPLFEVRKLALSNHKLSLGWGLEYSARSAAFYPFPIIVFRGDVNGRYIPYNAFSWRFQMQVDLPADVRLQVEILTPMKFDSFLMPGSISHNLPTYFGQAVKCTLKGINDLSASKIVCTNVGQLFAAQMYSIGCRATFPYDQFNLPLEQGFGSLTLYTVDPTTLAIDPFPATEASNPVEYIQTANNPDWFVSSSTNPFGSTLVSTQTALDAAMQDPSDKELGIFPVTTNQNSDLQRLIFTLSMPLKDVITPVVPGPPIPSQTIPYSGGLIVLANNLIAVSTDATTAPVLEPFVTTGTQYFQYQYKSSELAEFLEMKVYSSTTDGLLGMFCYNTNEVAGKYNQFAIKNAVIQFHTSLYADDYLLDFYFASFDQIEGTYPVFQKSLLYNGYTISTPAPANIRFGVANYYSGTVKGNDGTYFPTILRLAGFFEQADLAGAQKTISIFFQNMQPFAIEEGSTEVSCQYSGVSQPKCRYYSSGMRANGQSYHNFERVDIEFDTIPIGNSETFQLLIPVSTGANKQGINIFLAPSSTNPYYDTQSGLIASNAVYRLNGDTNLKTEQFTMSVQGSQLSGGYAAVGIINLQYTLDTTGLTVGTNGTSVNFIIGHSDVAFVMSSNSKSADQANGGGFTLTSTQPFYDSNTAFQSNFAQQKDPSSACTTLNYALITDAVVSPRYVIFCPFEQGAVSSTSQLMLSGGLVPFSNGDHLPFLTSFTWSDSKSGLKTFRLDPVVSIPNKGLLAVGAVSPLLRMGFKQEQLNWAFTTANPIPSGATIEIEFTGAIQFEVVNVGSYCVVESAVYGVLQHKCTVSYSVGLNRIMFLVSECPGCPLPAGQYLLRHWGIDNSNTPGTKVGYHMRTRSEQGWIIDQSSVQGTFQYDNSATALTMYLGNLKYAYQNRRARGSVTIDFQVDRQIWRREKVVLDMGGFANDNVLNQKNLRCVVLDSGGAPSPQWKEVDVFGEQPSTPLSSLQLIPAGDIEASQTFTLKCNGVLTPYSFNPQPVTAQLVLQNSVTVIQISSSVPIEPMEQVLFPPGNIALEFKSHNAPGSQTDFIFSFVSTKMVLDGNSRIYVNFPTSYSPYLTKNLTYCELNRQFVACPVIDDYTLVLQSFSGQVEIGETAYVRVFGVQQTHLYDRYSGQIFIGITNNTDQSILREFGFINDLVPQNVLFNPPINIGVRLLESSNSDIRSFAKYTFKVVLPPGSINVANNVTVDFPEEWDMIINYKLPSCSLFDFNNETDYALGCYNFGNRLTITIKQTDYIGNPFYYIVFGNVRNPDFMSCGIDRWVIYVTGPGTVIGRSHAAYYNHPTFRFVKNPKQITLMWVDLETMQEVSIVPITTGTFTGKVGLATDSGAFARSFKVYSVNPQFLTNPQMVGASMGASLTSCSVQGTILAPQGLSLVEFGKTDDLDRHTALPFLKVFLSTKIRSFTTENRTYLLPIGGQALPIYFDLTDALPASNLRIDIVITNKALYLSGAQNTILSATTPRGALVLAAEQRNVAVGDGGVISFLVTCGVSQFYTSLNSISYRITDANLKRPNVLISQKEGATRMATSSTFDVTCSQYSTLYYYAGIIGSEVLSQAQVIQRVLSFPQSDITSAYDQHFGLVNFFVANTTKSLTINKLRPQTTYNLTGFCVNTNQRFSSSQYLIFATKSNKGKSFTIDFDFQQPIDRQSTIGITCFLTNYFKLPARLIRNQMNDWCDYQRRMLQNNDERDAYSQQIARIYVSALDFTEIDSLTPALVTTPLNQSDIIAALFLNVAGLPLVNSVKQPLERSNLAPSIVNQSNISYVATTTNVSFQGFQLDVPGFIYVMLDWTNRSTAPTFLDVMEGITTLKIVSNDTQPPTLYSRQTYTTASPLSFRFKSLTHFTNYSLFYYGSSDDPTVFQPRTEVYEIKFQTPPIYRMNAQVLTACIMILLLWD